MLQYQTDLDAKFAALADPTRRAIVTRLSQGPRSCSELAQPLPMTLSAVGQHLRRLEASGIVVSEKIGRVRTCRLDLEALGAAEAWFAQRRRSLERRLDRLESHLSADVEKERER